MANDFTVFNRDDGFCEAFLRGLRSTFLSDVEYTNLKEGGQRGGAGSAAGEGKTKEDFEDMRLTLQETDYGNFLANEAALDPKLIATRATEKWVREFRYIRATATGALAQFMDYVAWEYQIDAILDLIKAATSGAGSAEDMQALVESCHPLGRLDDAVMKSILAYEDLSEDFHALYRTVLVDTPVGRYFTAFLQEMLDEKAALDPSAIRGAFSDIPMTLVENSVKKAYLEDFNAFCASLGGETAVVMCHLLATRADLLTINITYNSLAARNSSTSGGGAGAGASTPGGAAAAAGDVSRGAARASLFPAFGHLYPGGTDLLARVEDEEALRRALAKAVPEYAALWDAAPVDGRGVRDLSGPFFRKAVRELEQAFEGQFHYGAFYAYAKLKEQEVKNLAWIATCQEHGVYAEAERIIPIFSRAVAAGGAARGGR